MLYPSLYGSLTSDPSSSTPFGLSLSALGVPYLRAHWLTQTYPRWVSSNGCIPLTAFHFSGVKRPSDVLSENFPPAVPRHRTMSRVGPHPFGMPTAAPTRPVQYALKCVKVRGRVHISDYLFCDFRVAMWKFGDPDRHRQASIPQPATFHASNPIIRNRGIVVVWDRGESDGMYIHPVTARNGARS